MSGVRRQGVSPNCRRSSDPQEIRKVGSHSAAPDANLDTPSLERMAASCDRASGRNCLSGVTVKLAGLGIFLSSWSVISLYQEHEVRRAGLGFSERSRPRLPVFFNVPGFNHIIP